MDPLILLLAAAGLLMIIGAGAALVFGGRSDVDERMERYVGGSTTAVVPDEQPAVNRPAVGERLGQWCVRSVLIRPARGRIPGCVGLDLGLIGELNERVQLAGVI